MANVAMIGAVAAGGAVGAVLRYLTSLALGAGIFGIAGPLATLLVNIAGSAMMGGLAGLVAVGMVLPEAWRGFFAVGLLGALTTFSSFALDAGALWQKQGALMAGAYVMASVILSLLAFGAAFWVVKHSGIWQ
ncbi:MAG: CrcB family protein [Candidatus Puniceispirillum sp.]|nr:CrcB family protein [Candidatus Puniceispirillum sp.]MBL6775573.1 CrcB family protein [Candidatus Puniceispirillum sp.]